MMGHRLWLFFLFCAVGAVQASDLGPHTSREKLSQQARSGDDASAWSLGWLYYYEARYSQALAVVQGLDPGLDGERAYFKAWLMVSQGEDAQAELLMASAKCFSDECVDLSAVISIRGGDYSVAATSYADAFSRRKLPDLYVKMLGAMLLAKEYARFDLALSDVDWKNSAQFLQVRPRIQSLVKDRALFTASP